MLVGISSKIWTSKNFKPNLQTQVAKYERGYRETLKNHSPIIELVKQQTQALSRRNKIWKCSHRNTSNRITTKHQLLALIKKKIINSTSTKPSQHWTQQTTVNHSNYSHSIAKTSLHKVNLKSKPSNPIKQLQTSNLKKTLNKK